MNCFFQKFFAGACISIFIVDWVTAASPMPRAESPDTNYLKQVISAPIEKEQTSELRSDLISWLTLQVTNDLAEIEKNLKLNRSLEKKTCPSSIVFSYVESNKSLILAECEALWRRFVKQPAWLSVKPIDEAKVDQEITGLVEVLVLVRDIGQGEPVRNKDLVRKKLRATDFSAFTTQLNEYKPLIASKDLIAGEPIAQTDILIGQRVLIAASAIPSGSRLSDTLTNVDLRFENIPSDALKEAAGWAFMETNRTIMAGEIIRKRYLRKAKLVRRRDPVTLVNNTPAIQIITTGTALQDGYYGQSVKVINSESGRSVMGTVIGRGKVEINRNQ